MNELEDARALVRLAGLQVRPRGEPAVLSLEGAEGFHVCLQLPAGAACIAAAAMCGNVPDDTCFPDLEEYTGSGLGPCGVLLDRSTDAVRSSVLFEVADGPLKVAVSVQTALALMAREDVPIYWRDERTQAP